MRGRLHSHVYDMWYVGIFFFSSRRRHTRFDCDWSSDVCSSDLVHVGRRQLDVAERRRAEGKLVELLVEERAPSQVQGRTAPHPGPKLGHPGVGEVLATEQRAAVAAGAAGLVTEEEQGAALLFGGQRRVVVLEVAIER